MEGFQKPLSQPGQAEVGIAMIRVYPGGAECSCKWAKAHRRNKVVEDAAERHVDKRHGGRAVWL